MSNSSSISGGGSGATAISTENDTLFYNNM